MSNVKTCHLFLVSVINSPSTYYNEPGGWWITGTLGQFPLWRLPADQPQCIYDNNDVLYCLWHGNDDTTDVSAGGIFNGELYGSYSTDNGITWLNYVNLTNTRSPGAPPGVCYDENYMTAHPCVYNDSIWITYIEDKNAGGNPGETDNPVRCWVFPKDLISGLAEKEAELVLHEGICSTIFSGPLLLPTGNTCKVFDITGRVVLPDKIKPGIYFIQVDGQITRKVVKVR